VILVQCGLPASGNPHWTKITRHNRAVVPNLASDGVVLRRATAADAGDVAEVWLASFADALPTVTRAHDDDEVRGWVRDHLVPEVETWVATVQGEVVALLALAPGWIEQLYVAPGHQGAGIGGRLVQLAQQRADGPLQLWTFQVNARARSFYRQHGFREVELTDGSANEEREPDVRLEWVPG
jgi:GNAT superfamily N-acetyltransferase